MPVFLRSRLSAVVLCCCLAACGGSGSDREERSDAAGEDTSGAVDPTNITVSTSTAGNGTGEISPGARPVTQGQTTSFTLTPAEGSEIASVSGCGGSLSGDTYTTGPINAACTVSVTFSLKTYEVTATSGSGGSIGPGSVTLEHGSSTEFSLSAEPGFEIAEVSGCGGTAFNQDISGWDVSSVTDMEGMFGTP